MKTHLEHVYQVGQCGNQNFDDIAYGFLIGGSDGFVIEGRGFDFQGQLTDRGWFWNSVFFQLQFSFSEMQGGIDLLVIAFMGNYEIDAPNGGIINSTQRLLSDAVALGKLNSNYKIGSTRSSSYKLFDVVRDFAKERFFYF